MVQESLKQSIHEGWERFWIKRGIDPNSLAVSYCTVGHFTLPRIYEYTHRKSVQTEPNATRQAKAVGMVRAKCKG